MPSFGCQHCKRSDFRSQNALNRHQRNGLCATRRFCGFATPSSPTSPMSIASTVSNSGQFGTETLDELPYVPLPGPPKKVTMSLMEKGIEEHDTAAIAHSLNALLAPEDAFVADDGLTDSDYPDNERESDIDSLESDLSSLEPVGPDTSMRDQFREYVTANERNSELSATDKTAVRLLHLLKEKKASMNTYEALMNWHLKESNQIHSQARLQDTVAYTGRRALLQKLAKRYNYVQQFPFQKAVKLPVSGTVVNITLHDTKAVIQRLLTDPRIKPEDYLFWEPGNPLAPPPETLDYVEDVTTGQAYRDTYDDMITEGGQALLGVILYCDGTPVSHFHNMELIQVKIALTIHTRKARLKPHMWGVLGYIEKVHEQGGRGRNILEQANHLDTQDGANSVDSDESLWEVDGIGDKNDQDFHAMMEVILYQFTKLQAEGFLWDHHDPVRGITYRDVHYKVFMPFIRSDTKEADLLCGKYNQRFSSQQICRKCHIPLQQADDHMANYPCKTVQEITKLVDKADFKGLKALSQSYLRNAFHKIQFSTGNNHGIHGSCPSELLHAFLLGTFKYIRDIFLSTSEKIRKVPS